MRSFIAVPLLLGLANAGHLSIWSTEESQGKTQIKNTYGFDESQINTWCSPFLEEETPFRGELEDVMYQLRIPRSYWALARKDKCAVINKMLGKVKAKASGGGGCAACVSQVCPYLPCPGDDKSETGLPPKSNCKACQPLFCPSKTCNAKIPLSSLVKKVKMALRAKTKKTPENLPVAPSADLRLLKVFCNKKLPFWSDSTAFVTDLRLMATNYAIPSTGEKKDLCVRICEVASARIGATNCDALQTLDIPVAKPTHEPIKFRPTPLSLKWFCDPQMPSFNDGKLFMDELKIMANHLTVSPAGTKRDLCKRIKATLAGSKPEVVVPKARCPAELNINGLLKSLPDCAIEFTRLMLPATGMREGETCPICSEANYVFQGEYKDQLNAGAYFFPIRVRADLCRVLMATNITMSMIIHGNGLAKQGLTQLKHCMLAAEAESTVEELTELWGNSNYNASQLAATAPAAQSGVHATSIFAAKPSFMGLHSFVQMDESMIAHLGSNNRSLDRAYPRH